MFQDKTILITGASSGIGEACAKHFGKLRGRLILAARRIDRLKQLADSLAKTYQIEVLPIQLDVRNTAQMKEAIESLPSGWQTIDILINNAGLALGTTPIQNSNPDDWDTMIDTNVKALLRLTRIILPSMIQRNSGHIINIGSIAGHSYYPGGNVYCATKHAVKAITHCLRIDLAGTAIRVSEVDPGAVHTEFSEVRWQDKEKAEAFYKGFIPLSPDDVANSVVFCASQPPHVNIVEIMVMSTEQNSPTMITKIGSKPEGSVFDKNR